MHDQTNNDAHHMTDCQPAIISVS